LIKIQLKFINIFNLLFLALALSFLTTLTSARQAVITTRNEIRNTIFNMMSDLRVYFLFWNQSEEYDFHFPFYTILLKHIHSFNTAFHLASKFWQSNKFLNSFLLGKFQKLRHVSMLLLKTVEETRSYNRYLESKNI
jgi:hypothetical protein